MWQRHFVSRMQYERILPSRGAQNNPGSPEQCICENVCNHTCFPLACIPSRMHYATRSSVYCGKLSAKRVSRSATTYQMLDT